MAFNRIISLLVFLLSISFQPTTSTIQPAQTSNTTMPQSIQDLRSQHEKMQTVANDLERKVSFWHAGALAAVGLASLFGVLAFVFQQTESERQKLLTTTNKTISTITEQIHELERQNEAVARRALERRELSPEQFRTISETLLSFPRKTAQVMCPSGNQEAFGFAKQISRVLESAHWETGGGTVQLDNAPQNTGITLFVREADFEGAEHLRDALAKAGIWSSINVRNPLPGVIRVYVGPKP